MYTIVNCLEDLSLKLVVPHLPSSTWINRQVKEALIAKFGNTDIIATRKMNFITITILEEKTLLDFADRFYAEA